MPGPSPFMSGAAKTAERVKRVKGYETWRQPQGPSPNPAPKAPLSKHVRHHRRAVGPGLACASLLTRRTLENSGDRDRPGHPPILPTESQMVRPPELLPWL